MSFKVREYAICLVVALALSLSILTCTPTPSKAGMITSFSLTTTGATREGGSGRVNYEGSAMRMAQRQRPEESWQKAVLEHAAHNGWKVHYVPDSLYRRSFAASNYGADQGDRGFPDLILVRGDQILFRELKAKGGKLSEYQILWEDALINAGQDWDVWYPEDLDTKVLPTLWGDRIREGL